MNRGIEKISSKNIVSNRLKYLSTDEVLLDYPFILCAEKKLRIGHSYLKIENWLTDKPTPVKLLGIWDNNGIVYLKIQDLETLKVDVLSYNLEYEGGFWIWIFASLNYLIHHNLGKE